MTLKILLLGLLLSFNSFAQTRCEQKAIKFIEAAESINFNEGNHITKLRVERSGRDITLSAWVLVDNGDTKYTLSGVQRLFDHEGDCIITGLKVDIPTRSK